MSEDLKEKEEIDCLVKILTRYEEALEEISNMHKNRSSYGLDAMQDVATRALRFSIRVRKQI